MNLCSFSCDMNTLDTLNTLITTFGPLYFSSCVCLQIQLYTWFGWSLLLLWLIVFANYHIILCTTYYLQIEWIHSLFLITVQVRQMMCPSASCCVESYAGFRLACRSPHCCFDDDICTIAQASLAVLLGGKAKTAWALIAAYLKRQAVITLCSGKAASSKLVWN